MVASSAPTDRPNTPLSLAADDGCLYAVNASDGAFRWKSCTGGRVESSATAFGLAGHPGGVVAVGSLDGTVYCFDGRTGATVWTAKIGREVGSSPAIDRDGRLFVGGTDSVWALNATTGDTIWRYKTDAVIGSSPALIDGALLVGSEGGYLYKLE